jgi:ArsR family transcriptional regulator
MKRQSLAKTLKALSDPTRLSIFDMLTEGMHCNCEISEQLDLSLSLVSHHLRILREVGLVQGQRDPNDARWIHYSVNQNAMAELSQALGHLLDTNRIKPRVPQRGSTELQPIQRT